jgi:anti-sigma-K factor RskA
MTSADRSDHTRWEELAAGYALHALEPAEEAELLAHLRECAECRGAVDQHTLVAAQLASIADGHDADTPPWERIRPGLGAAPHATAAPAATATIHRLRRRHPRVLAAAAAVVVLAAIGVTGWQVTGDNGSTSKVPAAVAACKASPPCHVVTLRAGAAAAGDVLVRATTATVVPTAMPALDPSHVYVLWQLARDGRPAPVTVLGEVRTSQASAPAALVIPYVDTVTFAMSVELADRVPTKPTKVVAVGSTV